MGGAEVALLNVIAVVRQTQPEWQLSLITPEDGPLVTRAGSLGVECRVINFSDSVARLGDSGVGGPAGKQIPRLRLFRRLLMSAPAVLSAIVKLRRALRSLHPDIVHTNGFKMHVLGALAKPKHIPLIWHIHDYVSSRPLMGRLIKALRKRCSLILAVSESVKRDIEQVCGDSVKVQTVYNAVDTKEFSPEGERLDLDSLSGLAVNGSRESFVRIGLLATFGIWKGQEVFLRALALLPSDVRWRGYIIGDAIYQTEGSQFSRAELQSMASELEISDRVGFTGFVDQPANAIRALDIVVHASTRPEPFGLTIVEGMACGRPVVVSNAGGAAELITNGEDALGFPPGDATALADHLTRLITDRDLRDNLERQSRATAERRFGHSHYAKKLVSIYQATRRNGFASTARL